MISPENGSLEPAAAAQARDSSADLTSRVAGLFGSALVAALPSVSMDGDSSLSFEHLRQALRDTPVVLFPDVAVSRLDDFFRLRLQQILHKSGPLPSLSIVGLALDGDRSGLAGFAARFRSSWPFSRCLFITWGFDPAPEMVNALGLPVIRLDADKPVPQHCKAEPCEAEPWITALCETAAEADQPVAAQIQPMWRRCGSTTAFQNQVEQLVHAGFLTIRVFTDASARRGPTLARRLQRVIPENAAHAGAHVNVIAVPSDAAAAAAATSLRTGWAAYLKHQSSCQIEDQAVRNAVEQADSVIVNHMHMVGLALSLAPFARLLLDVHDDQEAAARQAALSNGASAPQAEVNARHVASLQSAILAIPDVCTYVSQTEAQRLGRLSRRGAVVLPRVYPEPAAASATLDFDLFLTGDRHVFNIISFHWFVENVWRPYLQQAGLRAAVVGRIGEAIDQAACSAPGLCYTGFVEDIETFRASCRLTVVPDRAGTGIAVKMLTALAAGHPMVTTTTGLRGLDPAVAGLIPAFDTADAMAADILGLLSDPHRLEERRGLVQRMQQAIAAGPNDTRPTDARPTYKAPTYKAPTYTAPTYTNCLAAVEPPTAGSCGERHARWAAVIAPAAEAPVAPLRLPVGTVFPFSGTPWDHQMLAAGWHEAERWGRWTDGTNATLRITLDGPAADPLALEINIMPSSLRPWLAVAVEGGWLPPIQPVDGPQVLNLPPEAVLGKDTFVVQLHVDEAICPALRENSPDERILGIGVRSIRLLSRQPMQAVLGQTIRLSPGSVPWDLLLDGWHGVEDWGCWTAGRVAELAVTLAAPCAGRIGLELDILPAASGAALTVSLNHHALPEVVPLLGLNRWELPVELTAGQDRLVLGLTVSATIIPAAAGGSPDDRVMGIGVRSLTLRALDPPIIRVGETVTLDPTSIPDRLLRVGWHKPEPWGCWTSGEEATLHMGFPQPLAGPFCLTLVLTPSPNAAPLTMVVNGQVLPPVVPRNGINDWLLPAGCTDGRTELAISLCVTETFCPASVGTTADDRVLGIGVRSITLNAAGDDACSHDVCRLGETVRISSASDDRGILRAGWHTIEPWGCWSAGNDAGLQLAFEAPLAGAFVLELDLVPPLLAQPITVTVGDTSLPKRWVRDGVNRWDLPRLCTEERSALAVRLTVEKAARPLDVQESTDDRLLGIGIRSLRLASSTLV